MEIRFFADGVPLQRLRHRTALMQPAVSIDDIVCVVNSERHKEKSYDPYSNMSTLQYF